MDVPLKEWATDSEIHVVPGRRHNLIMSVKLKCQYMEDKN